MPTNELLEPAETAEQVRESLVRRVVGHSIIRFMVVGGFSYSFDVSLLVLLHSVLHWGLSLATSVAFGTTLVLNFGLNRAAFRSKGLIGRALLRYIVLVVADWLVTLAVTTGMTALGTPYVIARTEATVFAAAVNYVGYRWWVFRT